MLINAILSVLHTFLMQRLLYVNIESSRREILNKFNAVSPIFFSRTMEGTERIPLLRQLSVTITSTQLTLFFAVACIVDQFGVNPIIVLPRAIILCGW